MPPSGRSPAWSIAVHGGAGAMRTMSADREAAYRAGLAEATRIGARHLDGGGAALRACILAVRVMERSGAFNAGRGSCLTAAGQIEVDAAVMLGRDRSIGAVAAVPGVGNGVELAEAVRHHSPHCLLAGPGAVAFAEHLGFDVEVVTPPEGKLEQYRALLAARDLDGLEARDLDQFGGTHDEGDTVGAVALDDAGDLALAVSTGGIWLKRPGRVGDSPLPGAGFWAEVGVGAAIATGTGELITRSLLCKGAIDHLAHGSSVDQAGRLALDELVERFGRGKAGLVVMDHAGRVAMPFDTAGMGRSAMRGSNGESDPMVRIWPEESVVDSW